MSNKNNGVDKVKVSQAQASLDKFNAWAATQTDEDFYLIRRGAKLNRAEVAAACGVGTSSLNANVKVCAALQALEVELRKRTVNGQKILEPLVVGDKTESDSDGTLYDQSSKSVGAMRQELSRLKALVVTKDAEIDRLRGELEYYTEIAKVLSATGIVRR